MQSYNRRHNCSDTLILMGPFSPSPSSPGQCCVSFFCPRLLTTAAQHWLEEREKGFPQKHFLDYFSLKTLKVSLPVSSVGKVSQLILSPIVALHYLLSWDGIDNKSSADDLAFPMTETTQKPSNQSFYSTKGISWLLHHFYFIYRQYLHTVQFPLINKYILKWKRWSSSRSGLHCYCFFWWLFCAITFIVIRAKFSSYLYCYFRTFHLYLKFYKN